MASIFFILTFLSLLFFTASQARLSPAERAAVAVDSRSKIFLPSERSSEPGSSEFRPALIWHPVKRRFDWTRVIRRSFAVHNRHRERQFEVEAQIRPVNEEEKYLVGVRHHRHTGGGRAAIGRFRHRRSFLRRHHQRRSRWHRKEEEIEARRGRKKVQKLLAGL